MNKSFKVFILILILHLGYSVDDFEVKSSADAYMSTPYRWYIPTFANEVILRRPDPAGFEEGVISLLCRASVSVHLKPGKLLAVNGSGCATNHEGIEYNIEPFEMFEAYPGTISWVPAGSPPENAIGAGAYSDGNVAYVCRGWRGNDLLIGNLRSDENVCHVTKDGLAYELNSNLEILVVNAFGQASVP